MVEIPKKMLRYLCMLSKGPQILRTDLSGILCDCDYICINVHMASPPPPPLAELLT